MKLPNMSLHAKKKKDFTSIDIVYKPVYDKNVEDSCYFTDKIHLAYRSYIGRNIKVEEKVGHSAIRQCHYCKNFFAKSNENMNKHMKFCAEKEGITYCFNNREIIFFQDNF